MVKYIGRVVNTFYRDIENAQNEVSFPRDLNTMLFKHSRVLVRHDRSSDTRLWLSEQQPKLPYRFFCFVYQRINDEVTTEHTTTFRA